MPYATATQRPRRKGPRRRAGGATLLTTASLLAVAAAHAQEAEPAAADALVLDPLTVEERMELGDGPVGGYVATRSRAGTKTDTPLSKTPQSVTVVPREQIEDQNADSVAEALRYSAGIFTEYRGSSNFSDEMFLRGFSYVPRYLDGLTYGWSSLGKVNPYLLERVEVLRGPSSVLYGEANPGGIVNLVSKRPTGGTHREVTLGYGTGNRYEGGFDVGGRLSDELAYRVVGTGHSGEGVEDTIDERAVAILPSLTWTPTDRTALTVSAMYDRAPDAGIRNFREAEGTLYPTRYGYIPIDFLVSDPDFEKASLTQTAVGYQFDHAFDDVFSFRQVARFARIDSTHHTVVWGALQADDRTISRSASGGGEVFDQVGIDNQLQAVFQTGMLRHTALAGLDYKTSWRDYHWGRAPVASIDWLAPRYGIGDVTLTPSSDSDTTARQLGAYLQDQIALGDLTLSLGGRHDWASTEIEEHLTATTEDYDDRAFSWRAGAIYNLPGGVSPYVSYSTSFEPVLQAAPAGEQRFEPTTGKQWEAGVKFAPGSGDYQLIASVYTITQNNVIKTDPVTRLATQTGEIRSRGFELEAHAQVTANLSLVGSYSYIDSEVTESAQTSEVGRMPSRIPQRQASLWARYAFDEGMLAGLALGAGVRHVGESWGDGSNTVKVPSATLYDAMVSYRLGALSPQLDGAELQVNAANLTDERYTASCASAYACWYGAPRTVTASLRYRW
ncbi:TonB-dependent siderophore receptor [Azospirillum sp. ST 5-10]|uniref:TonB-dependent siderophore receptor n=1 Tax=unclassified Azospirillum TaxID=2630922 RepID=UPI003F4A26D3